MDWINSLSTPVFNDVITEITLRVFQLLDQPIWEFSGLFKSVELTNAYHRMNVFTSASQRETQGMVLMEVMAVGIPVIAVNASGVRGVVRNEPSTQRHLGQPVSHPPVRSCFRGPDDQGDLHSSPRTVLTLMGSYHLPRFVELGIQ